MASSRIVYDKSKIGGQMVYLATQYTILAREQIDRAVALAQSVNAGGNENANLEGSTEFGVAVGKGGAFYSAILNEQTKLNAILTSDLANLDQG